MEDLQTDFGETLRSSARAENHEDLDPNNAGGVGSREADGEDGESAGRGPHRDHWLIEGDYLVRRHLVPRTTLFSPLDCPDEPPPIPIRNIEVLRTTKPRFSGTPWPEMATVKDCWMARPSDAKSLLNPVDGSTLTWTGETLFERVMPTAPKGKTWIGGELVRVRKGSQRAGDVHPLQWWLMSTSARRMQATTGKLNLEKSCRPRIAEEFREKLWTKCRRQRRT